MAIDFPASPAVNDTYTFGDRAWKWNGEGWQTVPGANLTSALAAKAATVDLPPGYLITGMTPTSAALYMTTRTFATTVPFSVYLADVSFRQNAYAEWPISVAAGTYTLSLSALGGPNNGIFTITIDGNSVGTIDTYNVSANVLVISDATGIAITAGTHALRVTMATKNASSGNYQSRVSGIILTRTGA